MNGSTTRIVGSTGALRLQAQPLSPESLSGRHVQTVFHLIADDPAQRETALTIAENLTKDDSVEIDDIAIVAQAEGIEPLTAGGDGSDMVESLLETGIAVKACGNTLDLKDLAESDLVDGVETVPSGGGELTRLQSEGYAYIRP